MTQNQLKSRELDEKERHNRRQEELESKNIVSKHIGNVTNPLGRVLGRWNDPSWYNRNSQLVKDVANISFRTPLGIKSYLPSVGKTNDARSSESLPAICVLNFIPSIGLGDESQANAINVALQAIYMYTRHENSGRINYEVPDEGMYLLALDSVYMYYAWMVRLYAAVSSTDSANWFMPRAITQALRGHWVNLSSNLAQFRAYINLFAQRASIFNVPNVMPFYDRHTWLVSNLFKDLDIERAQLFAFNPVGFFIYNAKGSLDFTKLYDQTDNVTLAKITEFGNKMLDALILSEDIGIISGDILKAYGANNLYTMQPIDSIVDLPVVYSPEVLTQINSATMCGQIGADSDSLMRFNITQDTKTGRIYQGYLRDGETKPRYPRFRFDARSGGSVTDIQLLNRVNVTDRVVNIQKQDVSPDDVMVATRLQVSSDLETEISTVTGGTGYNIYLVPKTSGSELLTVCSIFYFDGGMTREVFAYSSFMVRTTLSVAAMQQFSRWIKFTWAPVISSYYSTFKNESSVAKFSYEEIFNSLDTANYAVISRTTLDNMHNVALQSMFAIPNLGTRHELSNVKPDRRNNRSSRSQPSDRGRRERSSRSSRNSSKRTKSERKKDRADEKTGNAALG